MTPLHLTLSWDLFVIVFFGVIIAYSFILGKHESIRVIICTYIAAIAGMGIGGMVQALSNNSTLLLSHFGLSLNLTVVGAVKLIAFIACIVLLAAKSGLDIQYTHETSSLTDGLLTAAFGFASAGLLLATLLTFVSGVPILDAQLSSVPTLAAIAEESRLMGAIITYQNIWFALPALLLIGMGFAINK